MAAIVLKLLYISLLLLRIEAGDVETKITPKGVSEKESVKLIRLPPCAACRMLTDSFKKGLERTSRSKFEGGDAAWEEEKMGSYKTSEVRLVEVQEKLCSEVDRGQKQCEALAEDHEQALEEWWHEGQATELHEWLCIDKVKVCCPTGHFGTDCQSCSGEDEKICNGHGKCKGDGTRKGNGDCICDEAYRGAKCNDCAIGFYESYRDTDKLLCSKCYRGCNGPCTGPGAKSCSACREGYTMQTEHGCMDINECITLKDPCPGNQFCVNNDGTYTCLLCDKSCDGCNGDGPDMCDKCAENYRYDEERELCLDNSRAERDQKLQFARYVTYAGLTLATCIILQRHTILAAIVGLSVAVYITGSEYYLTHFHEEDPAPNIPLTMKSSYQTDL